MYIKASAYLPIIEAIEAYRQKKGKVHPELQDLSNQIEQKLQESVKKNEHYQTWQAVLNAKQNK